MPRNYLEGKRTGDCAVTVTVRSADPGEVDLGLPQAAGTATVVPRTGAVIVPISTFQQFARAPGASQELIEFTEALLEQEFAYAMAILDADDTGIENNLWFQPVPGGQHGPRIKVMIDPRDAVRPGGKEATVPFDANKPASGEISQALERQVRAFIELNKPALVRYWNLEYPSTKKFIADLKPLPLKSAR
jgi:hypothetical protein